MTVEDRLEILEVIGRYAYAWDEKNAELYASWFTEDGILEVYTRGQDQPAIRADGRDAIMRWARGIHRGELEGMRPPDSAERTRHAPGVTVFDELNGELARTRTMLFETRVAGGASAPVPQVAGVYTDEWRCTAEGWRLVHRTLNFDRR